MLEKIPIRHLTDGNHKTGMNMLNIIPVLRWKISNRQGIKNRYRYQIQYNAIHRHIFKKLFP